jgi:uncharacterized protein
MNAVRLHDSRLVRLFCLGAGLTALGLGILGVVLPVLPTTPFILLAAACFARSSVRFHDWLLRQPIAGPIIEAWQTHRSMPRRAKQAGFVLMAISFGSSIWLMDSFWHRALLALLGLVLAFFLWRVPVREIPVCKPSQASTS